jgi:hypothetical protein
MPFPLIAIVIAIASLALNVVSALLRPKTKDRPEKDWDIPTATEGRSIPVVWGTDLQKAPNIIWWGDQKEVKRNNIWRYFAGMAWALAHGAPTLKSIIVNEKVIWTGALTHGQTLFLDKSDLFGKVSGGVVFDLKYYQGNGTTGADPYLASRVANYPDHRRVAYLVSRGPAEWTSSSNWKGFIGNSPSLPTVEFELVRFPDVPFSSAIGGDANPIWMLYEALTNDVWGCGVDPADAFEGVDTTSFQTAASQVASEGLGASCILQESMQFPRFADMILRHVDAVLYREPTNGKWTVKLIRNDYDPTQIPVLDETKIIDVQEFGTDVSGTLRDVVRIKFADRTKQYKESVATFRNPAVRAIQGYSSAVELDFPMVRDPGVAQRIAEREALGYSYPLRRLRVTATRKAAKLRPGDVFRFVWAGYDVDAIFRVTSIRLGSPADGVVIVEAVEDKFSIASTTIGAQPSPAPDPEEPPPPEEDPPLGDPPGGPPPEEPPIF